MDGVRGLLCSFGTNIKWDDCNSQCIRPCRENRYDVTVTSPGGWPMPAYHRAFYDNYVKGTGFANEFDRYAREAVSCHHLALFAFNVNICKII